MLSRKSVSEFTDKELQDFVNDPAVQEVFLTNTTALIDNRRNVASPMAGKNIFQLEEGDQGLDPRFKTGTAQFIYGALKQKINRQEDIRDIQE